MSEEMQAMGEPEDPAAAVPGDAQTGGQPPAADADVTPFEDVDVEEGVTPEARASEGERLSGEEVADIAAQVQEIETANRGRGAGEQVSTAPEDVS
ncbi:hypothetical protein ACTMTJ_20670 [Phytohabitans sp. LJ34]|uniref:hypothetical protein n=1 Tax=Phytohabitans sp. LJ34 TaxID=3452217 RepID=UPI003F8BFA38